MAAVHNAASEKSGAVCAVTRLAGSVKSFPCRYKFASGSGHRQSHFHRRRRVMAYVYELYPDAAAGNIVSNGEMAVSHLSDKATNPPLHVQTANA